MQAVVVEGTDRVAVRDVEIPSIREDEVLVQICIANICSQTDLHIIQGLYCCGLTLPFVLGHEAAGVVVKVGACLQDQFSVGDRVACKGMTGCMAEYAAFREDALVKLPDSVSFEAASMFEVAACAYELVRQTVQMGDKVLLVGQGCAGLLGTIFCKLAGAASVVVVEPNAYKRSLSKRYGADIILEDSGAALEKVCDEVTGGQGFEATLEFAGLPQTMDTCIKMLKPQGRLGMFGVGCKPFAFDFFQLHDKMGIIVTAGHSYGYNEVPYRKMLDLTVSGKLPLDEFVTHHFPLAQVEEGLKLIRDKDERVLRIALIPPAAQGEA